VFKCITIYWIIIPCLRAHGLFGLTDWAIAVVSPVMFDYSKDEEYAKATRFYQSMILCARVYWIIISHILSDDIFHFDHIALDLSNQIELITGPIQIMSLTMDLVINITLDVVS
jgi:hypothetical protein